MTLYSPVDTGYAWIVLACATLINCSMGMFAGGMGIMMVEFTHFFNISKTVTAWVGACAFVTGPVMGECFV